MQKALREAKLNTSWTNPDDDYENAAIGMISDLLNSEKSPLFIGEIDEFVPTIADAGYVNSLSQVVLKMCVPGVPDFYQGTELWDFSLVDPDNRRSVDYSLRSQLLKELSTEFAMNPVHATEQVASHWPNDSIKLLVIWRLLHYRQEHPGLFEQGAYIPLQAKGERERHVLAFGRAFNGDYLIAVVPRLVQKLLPSAIDRQDLRPPYRSIDWKDAQS